MNVWFNYKGMSITKDAILNSSMAGASFYSRQLDREMYFIRNLQLQFLNDKDLQKLSFRGGMLENYEEVELIEQVRDRQSTLTAFSDYIVNAGVYVEAVGKTISTMSGVTNTPNPEMELVASLISTTPKPSYYQYGERIFLIESENNDGVWSYIELSRSKLLEALNQIADLYQESEVLLGSKELGTVLTTAEQPQEASTILAQISEQSIGKQGASEIKKIHGINYFIIHNDVSSLHLSLIMYVNQNEITRPLNQFTTWSYLLFIIAIVIMVLYSFSVNLMIHRPLSRLVKAFRMLEADNLNIMIQSRTKDEFHYVFNSFNNMALKLKNSIRENYEQKIALQHSQLKQLQSQINPHFLYNSFFNIYMMCKVGDADSAAELSQRLGRYYQYITRSGADEVPFSKEYQHAVDYCEIQCIRFSNRISFEYGEVKDVPASLTVPRLIIQPIVENVFEHAFEDGTMEGVIYMSTEYRDGKLRVTVEDNGQLMTEEMIEQLRDKLATPSKYIEKTGLINVNIRLQLKYGEGSGLFVSRSSYGGLRVDLIINANEEE